MRVGRRPLGGHERFRRPPVDNGRNPEQNYKRWIPCRIEQIAGDEKVDFLVVQLNGRLCSANTHAKNTAKVSELNTIIVSRRFRVRLFPGCLNSVWRSGFKAVSRRATNQTEQVRPARRTALRSCGGERRQILTPAVTLAASRRIIGSIDFLAQTQSCYIVSKRLIAC